MGKVQVPQLVNRRPLASPRGTSLDSTRQQHSLPLQVGSRTGPQSSSPYEDNDSREVEPPPKEDGGLYIPSYLEEAILDDPTLQVKVAHAL